MASISVIESGWQAELDIPEDDDVMDWLRREYMLGACALVQTLVDPAKVTALGMLRAAIKTHFSDLPVVKLTEE